MYQINHHIDHRIRTINHSPFQYACDFSASIWSSIWNSRTLSRIMDAPLMPAVAPVASGRAVGVQEHLGSLQKQLAIVMLDFPHCSSAKKRCLKSQLEGLSFIFMMFINVRKNSCWQMWSESTDIIPSFAPAKPSNPALWNPLNLMGFASEESPFSAEVQHRHCWAL